jgi:hypothetical protein
MSETQPVINAQTVLRDLQDELVLRAERLVNELGFKGADVAESGKTQASKALEVAQSAGSLPVFLNWVRYQAGREKSADFWRRSAGRQDLARALSGELLWIQKQVHDQLGDLPKAEQDVATMRAVVRFLGYFRRALIGAKYLQIAEPQPEASS